MARGWRRQRDEEATEIASLASRNLVDDLRGLSVYGYP